MNLISEDYLMHYGVKGMKWGVRHDPERVGRTRRQAIKDAGGWRKSSKDGLKGALQEISANRKSKGKKTIRQTLDDTYGKVGKKQKYTQKNQFYKMSLVILNIFH